MTDTRDEYTRDELRRLAWLKVLGVPTDTVLRDLGRHTRDSIDMAWLNLQGKLPNASEGVALPSTL